MSDRKQNYPIAPAPDDDPRFTLGVTLEVADVLQKHGYAKLEPLDVVELQQALFRFLYRPLSDGDTGEGEPTAEAERGEAGDPSQPLDD